MFPSIAFQLLLGDPNVVPGQMGDVMPPASPGHSLGLSLRWTCPEHFYWEVSCRHPEQMLKLPQPAVFNTKEQRGSTLSSLQMSKVLTLSLRLRPALSRGISSQLLYL